MWTQVFAFEVLVSQIKVSPILAAIVAYVPSVITLYVSPTLAVPSVGSAVIVAPEAPTVPLNTIGSGSVFNAAATAVPFTGEVPVELYVLTTSLEVKAVTLLFPRVIVLPEIDASLIPYPWIVVGFPVKLLNAPSKLEVPAPIFVLALDCSVVVNPWFATVETALKLPTFPNPTSDAVKFNAVLISVAS